MNYKTLVSIVPIFFVAVVQAEAQGAPKRVAIENGTGLELVQIVPQTVTYKGYKALRLVEAANIEREPLALLNDIEFKNGTIEFDLAGLRGAWSRRHRSGIRRDRVSIGTPRRRLRVYLHPADQRTRRRPAAAQSLDTIHIGARLPVAEAPNGTPGCVRVVRRSRNWRVDTPAHRG